MLPKKLLLHEPPLVIVGWGLIVGAVFMNFIEPVWHIPAGLHLYSWASICLHCLWRDLLSLYLICLQLKNVAPSDRLDDRQLGAFDRHGIIDHLLSIRLSRLTILRHRDGARRSGHDELDAKT
jgi:hypothetical protein